MSSEGGRKPSVRVRVREQDGRPAHTRVVPVDRITCVHGSGGRWYTESWIAISGTQDDLIADDVERSSIRDGWGGRIYLERTPPWELAARLNSKGGDFVRVFNHSGDDGGDRRETYVLRSAIVAVTPHGIFPEPVHLAAAYTYGRVDCGPLGTVILSSGHGLALNRNGPDLLPESFQERALLVPTKDDKKAAVLPEAYRGLVGFDSRGQALFGIALGTDRRARVIAVESSFRAHEIPGLFGSAMNHLSALVRSPGTSAPSVSLPGH